MKIKVPYWISNNGDGSASLRLCKTPENAEKADEKQDEGWGESSAGELELIVEGDKVFFEKHVYDKGKSQTIRIEVPQKKGT